MIQPAELMSLHTWYECHVAIADKDERARVFGLLVEIVEAARVPPAVTREAIGLLNDYDALANRTAAFLDREVKR